MIHHHSEVDELTREEFVATNLFAMIASRIDPCTALIHTVCMHRWIIIYAKYNWVVFDEIYGAMN